MRTASITADRKSTVAVGTRDQAASVERAQGAVSLESSGTGPRIGSARVGPKFGLADSSIAIASRLASKLRAPFAVAARSAVRPKVIALARLVMSLPLRVSALRILAPVRVGSAIAVDQRLAARIACAGSLVARPRPLAKISGRSSLLPPRAIPKARVAGASAIGTARMITTARLATKDSWVPAVVGCADDANKNGTDLQLEGINAKQTFLGWDLSSFPAAATIVAATLRLKPKSTPVTANNNSIFKIANADEGWSESGIVCSNRPASDGAAMQTLSSPSDTNEQVIVLNSAVRSRIQDRMGVGNVTLMLVAGPDVTNYSYESKDEGTNDAQGPRLELEFTLP